MQARLDAYLVKKCPTLFADRFASMRTTAMCWGFDVGDGWYQLLKEACMKIEPILAACKAKDPVAWKQGFFRASQIKEKFGTLRFYVSGAPDEVHKIIHKAEIRSTKTCEVCGKPGKLRGPNWYYTACIRHTNRGDR